MNEIRSVIAALEERRTQTNQIIQEAAFGLEAALKELLTGSRSGRTYRRKAITRAVGRRGKVLRGSRTQGTESGKRREIIGYQFYRASAPGEAPGTDTGNLANSIMARVIGDGAAEVSLAFYAAYFDPVRPFIQRGIDKIKPTLARLEAP